MLCANCGVKIKGNHLRAGLNGSNYCGKVCSYEAYEGFYTRQEVDGTMVKIKIAPKRCTASEA